MNLLERAQATEVDTAGRERGEPAAPVAGPERERAADVKPAPVEGDRDRGSLRHCWVIDPPGRPGRWPGVLIGWIRGPDGLWSGHVVFVVMDGGRESVVIEYVPGGHLRPATETGG
jgi:hypothetical protein